MQRNAIMLISRIHEAAAKWISDELAAAGLEGVAPSHGDVLALLFRQKEATMHELAAFARRTKPTMTVLVGKLENMGLVTRTQSPLDARCQIVRLTPEGERLRPAFASISRRLVERAYAGLSPADARRLEAALAAMLARFDPSSEETKPNRNPPQNRKEKNP